MRIDVFSIFPDMVDGFCSQSLLGRARRTHHIPQHLPQQRRIIGQGGKVDLHMTSIANPAAPTPMNPA